MNRDDQSAKDRIEHAHTVKIQKAQNGFILKTIGGPMIFTDYKGMSDYLKGYFDSLPVPPTKGKL